MAPDGDVPFMSIVVPTRNRADDLRVCIASLIGQDYPAERFEVVVVDDGSTDGTADAVAGFDRRVRLVSQTARGSSAARNAGLIAARSDPVCFVDDDVAAPPGWLRAMVAGFARHPDADAFTGPIRASIEGDRRACPQHPLASSLDIGDADADIDAGLGANMAIRRRAVARVGPFDEWVAIGGADTEWFDRLRAAGGRTVYVGDAGLLHRRSAARLRLPTLLRSEFRRGAATHRYLLRRERRDGSPSSLRSTLRLAVHGLRDGCTGGLAQAARSAGIGYGLFRHARLRPPPTVQR